MDKFKIEIEVDVDFLDCVMVTALEGGINYWADDVIYPENEECNRMRASDIVASTEHSIVIVDCEGDPHNLNREKLLKGLSMYAKEHGLTTDAGQIDATAADLIIQFALFGEIVYG